MSDLDFSHALDRSLVSDAPEVAALVGTIKAGEREAFTRNLTTILLNLFAAHLTSPDLHISYSRTEGDYRRPKGRYDAQALSYTQVIKAVDVLLERGLIHHAKGFQDRGRGAGRLSRMKASPQLLALFSDHGWTPAMVRQDRGELIQLKDADKNLIDYRETGQTRRMRRNLEDINAALLSARVEVALPDNVEPILLTSRTLYRVFNVTWDRGGRFYGHFLQGLGGSVRAKATIDGEPVAELDFSGMSVNLLYALDGLPLPTTDAYYVGYGPEDKLKVMRDELIKVAFQVMLNTADRESAKKTITKVMKESSEDFAEAILKRLEERHADIAHHFYTDVGLKLQGMDSRIAEGVLLDLLKEGIVSVPVHDSFIVKRRHQFRLREAMNKVSKEVVGVVLPIKSR